MLVTCLVALLRGSMLFDHVYRRKNLEPYGRCSCSWDFCIYAYCSWNAQRVPVKSQELLAVSQHSLPKLGELTGFVVSEDLYRGVWFRVWFRTWPAFWILPCPSWFWMQFWPEVLSRHNWSHLAISLPAGAMYEVVRYTANIGDLCDNLSLQLWMLTC